MVRTFLPLMLLTGSVHDRTVLSLTITVHAPQIALPQPYFVPVRPRSLRNTHRSVRWLSVVKLTDYSLSLKDMVSFIPTLSWLRFQTKVVQPGNLNVFLHEYPEQF